MAGWLDCGTLEPVVDLTRCGDWSDVSFDTHIRHAVNTVHLIIAVVLEE